ncbi:MAG: sugar ABC transporter substrate-binding protein [Hungateiclostridium thermocellum]|nr:sugar ABC transporter substrate-binding protein [Acetivibrio thermocellus]
MKKSILLLAVLVLMSCLLGACGKTTGSTGTSTGSNATTSGSQSEGEWTFPTEDITLRWSFWASSEEWPYWGPGIEEFEKMHPNVKFVIETTPWSEYWNKLSTQVASNSQPDITGMTTGTSREYLANGSLLDLTDYMERDSKDPNSGWKTDNYWPGVFWGYTYKGRIYGVPYDMGPMGICLNLDIFEEFGVDIPDEDWTFDDMIEIAKKLTVDRDGDGVIDVYGLSWTPTDSDFYDNFILSLGSDFVIGEEPNQTVEVSPITAECLQKIADGVREGWNYDKTQAQDLGLFVSGKIAMISANPEWFGKYAKLMEKPNLYAMQAPMSGNPKYDTGNKYIGGGGFSIGSNTKYPEVCWEFLKHYLSEEGVKRTTAIPFRGIPPHKTLMDEFVNSEFAPKNTQALLKFMNRENPDNVFFTCPNWNKIRDIMSRELQAVYSGVKTAEEAIDVIVKEGNRLVREPE